MSKDKLISLELREKKVTIRGITLIIKQLNAGDAAKYENSLYKIVGDQVKYQTEDTRTKLVLLTVYDEEGNRMFKDADLELVKRIPSDVVNEIFDIASSLNGLEGKSDKSAKN